MGELVLGTLHPLARLSNVSMGMVVLGHGMEMMILPWQPHVLQSVVVTLPLLRTAQPPTGMGAATVLAIITYTCSEGETRMAVCDAATSTWLPSTIPDCPSGGEVPVPMPTPSPVP